MSSIYGKNLKISLFGQSHSPGIGVTVEGLPPGFAVDFEELNDFMSRRRPGGSPFATPRREADHPEFLSGLVGNVICGAPLTAVIRNTNTRSGDYEAFRDLPRPGHADFTAQLKFGGAQDTAGGGHFSGRLTAPLCLAGGIVKQVLRQKGIFVAAHIASVGEIEDDLWDPCREIERIENREFPVLNPAQGEKMQRLILDMREQGDSVGGTVECMISGVPGGVGDPIFDGIESRVAQIVFGIPAVKGLEFGSGFAGSRLRGSQNNDPYTVVDGNVRTETNRAGGILGGITTGMPVVFRAAFKPTPSIARPQKSVRLSVLHEDILEIQGRHDPCVVVRAVPCVEAAAAIAIYDALLDVR